MKSSLELFVHEEFEVSNDYLVTVFKNKDLCCLGLLFFDAFLTLLFFLIEVDLLVSFVFDFIN
jgi:hypothetical protein